MGSKPLVAVTQRIAEIPSYGETRDCLDQEWTAWLSHCGYSPVLVPNRLDDVAAYLAGFDIKGLILTGGNNLTLDVYDNDDEVRDAFESRDATELAAIGYCSAENLPVLGYCRGMQLLHAYAGGRLSRLESGPVDHVGTFHIVDLLNTEWQDMAGDPTVEVNSFHDYGLLLDQVMTSDWEVAAISEKDRVVEGLVHRRQPFIGIGWHPERKSRSEAFDRRLLEYGLGRGKR